MKQLLTALVVIPYILVHGRKIVQEKTKLQTDVQESDGIAGTSSFEQKAMQMLERLESKIERLESQGRGTQAPAVITLSQEDVPSPAANSSGHPKVAELFEGCKPSTALEERTAALVSKAAAEAETLKEAIDSDANESSGRCGLHDTAIIWYRSNAAALTGCCGQDQDCSGCERMSQGKCSVREAAFVKLPGDDRYSACMDIAGWVDEGGKTCFEMSSKDCSARRVQGTSSQEACCKCGGGIKTATPFKYEDHTFILGERVSLWPKPRTAARYGLDEGCEFVLYNLTLDGATGEVGFIAGKSHPKEPFKVSCKVTAFQAHKLFYTADVTVAVGDFSYGPTMLVFSPKTTSFSVRKSGTEWKDFRKTCAPEAPWLSLDADGTLKSVSASETGALDNVKDVFLGQTGTVCQISALTRPSKTAAWVSKSMGIVAVKPKPAKTLKYPTTLLASSVSQTVPPTKPAAFAEGEMAPSQYAIRCDKADFQFDVIHGIGLYKGHPLLELQSNGQLSLNVGPSFVRIFDGMGSTTTDVLQLTLKCRITGSFPDPDLTPISALMDIVVSDSTCWVQEKMRCAHQSQIHRIRSRAQCQHACRNRASCSHYQWKRWGRLRQWRCHDVKLGPSSARVCDVWAKIPDCSPSTTCVKVDATTWLERGTYCPLGYDVERAGMTYLKVGKTPTENIYLRKYKAGSDSKVDGCGNGHWLLQEKHPNDFQSLKNGLFEFAGPHVGCNVKSASYTGLTCGQPGNITEDEADVQPMVLDDPNTPEPADFWLHPCDCANKVWGEKPPVEPTVFAQLPPASMDEFIPSPMMLVEGQFVCPPSAMLGDGPLFESDIESLELGDCEIKCKNNDDCQFFWHGSQHAANTCRLYSSCKNLLREPGVEGILKAVPRTPVCLVSSPEACWTKSLRRYSLTTEAPQPFLYWNLHAQCDYMLLLGGWGVSGCTRPSLREIKSHSWKHKRHLPDEFAHGQKLKASCWDERYTGIRLGARGSEVATCVNGNWFSSSNLPNFGDFACLACVQVGTFGFGDVEVKRQQELYFFNKLALQLHSEVNPIADSKVSCLEPVRPQPVLENLLPEDLTTAQTFDLQGHDFRVMENIIGQHTLWTSEATKPKFSFQSFGEALVACAKDTKCEMVSYSDGVTVGGALRRFDLRKGNLVQLVGGKTWMKAKAIPCIGNCAALKPVTCSSDVKNCGRSLVDGRKAAGLWSVSPSSTKSRCHQMSWVQVDLGAPFQFDQVTLFGYPDGRKYCGHKIGVSSDGSSWRYRYEDHSYKAPEKGQGFTVNLGLQTGRYVRVFQSRSSSNTGSHFMELEIRRASMPQPAQPSARWLDSRAISALGTKIECKKSLFLLAENATENGTAEGQAARRRRRRRRRPRRGAKPKVVPAPPPPPPPPPPPVKCDYGKSPSSVTIDLREHGTLKGGKIEMSAGAWKIKCKLYCDGVLVLDEQQKMKLLPNKMDIPAICKGARSLKLVGGGERGHCKFTGSRLEVYNFPNPVTLTSRAVSELGTRAQSRGASWQPRGQVTIRVDEFGTVAPGNQVNFDGAKSAKCEVHCNGHVQTAQNGNRRRTYGRRRDSERFPLSKECIGANAIVLKGGGSSGGCMMDASSIKVSPHPKLPVMTKIPAKKIVAWFKSEDAGPTWKSSVGKLSATAQRKSNVFTYTARGYGAKAPVRYIQGTLQDTFTFPDVLQDHYTVCSVTRYASTESTGRILSGSKSNLLIGHHSSGVGVVYFDSNWQTKTGERLGSTRWTTVCASPGASYVFVDGINVGQRATNSFQDQSLMINSGAFPNEKSNWAVMEVITWNYILSEKQMEEASTYLMKKLMVGAGEDSCRVILRNPSWWDGRRTSSQRISLSLPKLSFGRRRKIQGIQGPTKDSQLDSKSGWCAKKQSKFEWLQISLKGKEKVMGVIIQGLHKQDAWVYSFQVQYKASSKGVWQTIPARFTGLNKKTEDHVRAYFTDPVEAVAIRLTSFSWHNEICLRAAVMVCQGKLENEVALLQAKTCPTNYNSESWSESDPASRHLRIGGTKECLALEQLEAKMALVYKPCVADDVHQMIPAADIGYLFTLLHRNSWLTDNALRPGVKAEFFYNLDKADCQLPNLLWRTPDKVEVTPQLNYPASKTWAGLDQNDKFAARMSGVLMINEPGKYTFYLSCDDSARLFFNHEEMIAINGCGGTRERSAQKALTMGSWPFEVLYYEKTNDASLLLSWKGPDSGNQKQVVPEKAFAHMADKSMWMPTSAVAKGCFGNTALGSLLPKLFLVQDLEKGLPMECRFVPLLSKELPVEISTNRTFGKDVSWPAWWEDMESWEMACAQGKVLQTIDFLNVDNRLHIKYTCATASGLGQCYPSWTDQQDAREFTNTARSVNVLNRFHIACPQHDLLNSVHFEYSMGGLWARFKYTCCKEAGAPVVTMSRGPDHRAVDSLEGTYCPQKVGGSGRMDYIQKAWGPWHTRNPAKLTFSEDTGKWCIGGDCSAEGDDVEPIGLQLGGLDTTAVSDFDGEFEAKGVGPPGGLLGSAAVPEVKPPPPPRRPKAPKKPALEKFEPEMPKYSDKCVGYGDLWKKVQETTINDAGEEEANANELETEEESASGYQDMHPCDLAQSFGGVRSKWAGGDGKSIAKPMPYDELTGCFDRHGAGSYKAAKAVRMVDMFVNQMGLTLSIKSTICSFFPEIITSPMGFGPSVDLGDKCEAIVNVAHSVINLVKESTVTATLDKIAKAQSNDCQPEQANFARMFCDMHCIRDAVIRGDRAILRNLKKATDITNGNTEKLAEWIVKTQQLDAGWLAEKIDHQSLVQSIENKKEFTAIKELVEGGDKKEMLLAVKRGTQQIQSELQGYVDGASFGRASALAASDALEKFTADGKSLLQAGVNSTQDVFMAFDRLLSLRGKLQSASDRRSKEQHVGMSVLQAAHQMQDQLKLQRATLGIYQQKANYTRRLVRQRTGAALTSERHAMLLDLDRIWWKIRGALDEYMDEMEGEITSFESGSRAMAQYERCAMDYHSLLSIYKRTMVATERSHRALKKTWRISSNLMGELASHLEDGEAFLTFFQQEGCESSLAAQTLEQARDAVGGLRMLHYRFRSSGLPSPELDLMESTVTRIRSSWTNAMKNACNITGALPQWYMPSLAAET